MSGAESPTKAPGMALLVCQLAAGTFVCAALLYFTRGWQILGVMALNIATFMYRSKQGQEKPAVKDWMWGILMAAGLIWFLIKANQWWGPGPARLPAYVVIPLWIWFLWQGISEWRKGKIRGVEAPAVGKLEGL